MDNGHINGMRSGGETQAARKHSSARKHIISSGGAAWRKAIRHQNGMAHVHGAKIAYKRGVA